jgi:signal transduction histidine kinase
LPRRLFWRVYLYGVLLLVAVAVSVGASSRLLWGGDRPERVERAARYLAAELLPLLDRPEELQARLARLHESFEVDLAVYRRDGTMLAQVGRSPPPPLAAPPAGIEHERRGRRVRLVVPLGGEQARTEAYLVGAVRLPASGAEILVLLLVVLGVLALVSLPLARGLAAPIERVAGAARAFGAGDLGARTGVRRGGELGELALAFDTMAGRIERLVVHERELLANVSHELRTPLARIRVALALAEESDADAGAVRGQLRGIGADLAELERLIEDVLTAARLDVRGPASARPLLRRESVLLGALLERASERFAREHPRHALSVDVEPAAAAARLDADPPLLRRVLDNLLDNAAKYSDPESGPVHVRAVLREGSERHEVEVGISDRGIGVEAADLPRLFEPFFRTDRSRARGTGGVGLGLALSRRVVEAHGGVIEAVSPDEGGLRVSFRLPLSD